MKSKISAYLLLAVSASSFGSFGFLPDFPNVWCCVFGVYVIYEIPKY